MGKLVALHSSLTTYPKGTFDKFSLVQVERVRKKGITNRRKDGPYIDFTIPISSVDDRYSSLRYPFFFDVRFLPLTSFYYLDTETITQIGSCR